MRRGCVVWMVLGLGVLGGFLVLFFGYGWCGCVCLERGCRCGVWGVRFGFGIIWILGCDVVRNF